MERCRSQGIDELPEGQEMSFDIAEDQIKFMGEIVGNTVIFGADNNEYWSPSVL